MALETPPRSDERQGLEAADRAGSLGINLKAGSWPTTPRLKGYEAAGFRHLQVQMPPRDVLADDRLCRVHASALAEALQLTGLELILHAPADLWAGSEEHDAHLRGAVRYAAAAACGLIVYHGAQVPIDARGVGARLVEEVRSLRRLAGYARCLGVRIAVENLAPQYPGREYVSHDPRAILALVRAVDADDLGICLDVGHAHIAAGLVGCETAELIEPVLERVILFEVHDNFGARSDAPRAGGIEPIRLDLHLAPGAGSVPWVQLAPLLARHDAPIQLEIDPGQRPEPATLAILMRELLGLATLSAR